MIARRFGWKCKYKETIDNQTKNFLGNEMFFDQGPAPNFISELEIWRVKTLHFSRSLSDSFVLNFEICCGAFGAEKWSQERLKLWWTSKTPSENKYWIIYSEFDPYINKVLSEFFSVIWKDNRWPLLGSNLTISCVSDFSY